jgi:hypothetical protein
VEVKCRPGLVVKLVCVWPARRLMSRFWHGECCGDVRQLVDGCPLYSRFPHPDWPLKIYIDRDRHFAHSAVVPRITVRNNLPQCSFIQSCAARGAQQFSVADYSIAGDLKGNQRAAGQFLHFSGSGLHRLQSDAANGTWWMILDDGPFPTCAFQIDREAETTVGRDRT